MAIEVSSREVLEEIAGLYCPRCGDWLPPGTTVDGATVHLIVEHPRIAEILFTEFMESRRLIAWALDIPEAMR